jgi:hypothetical protein
MAARQLPCVAAVQKDVAGDEGKLCGTGRTWRARD